jgi:hypothetical protein
MEFNQSINQSSEGDSIALNDEMPKSAQEQQHGMHYQKSLRLRSSQ